MTATILVAGIGNIFFSDDGFGPEVVRHLSSPGAPALPDDVRLVDYGIRGMHLAYDLLDGYAALVLIDALPGHGDPGEVIVLEVGPDDLDGGGELDAHGMGPVAVLSNLSALGGEMPPTYVVGAQPLEVGEGIGLTEPMMSAVPQAVQAVRSLLVDRLCGNVTPTLAPGRTE